MNPPPGNSLILCSGVAVGGIVVETAVIAVGASVGSGVLLSDTDGSMKAPSTIIVVKRKVYILSVIIRNGWLYIGREE